MANSDTRTITINTKIKSSAFTAEELSFLDVYLNHYNHIKFITTSKIKKKSLDGLKIADVKSLCDKNDVLPYRIFNAGLFQQVQGQIKSQLSNKKNYLDNVQDKIKSVENRLQKQVNTIALINSMTPVMRSYAANRTRLSEAVKKKTVFLHQLERLRSREQKLEKDIANNDFKICYGSADLLSKRNRIHPNDKEKLTAWRKQWNALRYGHMLFVGSTDENLGNSNANININKNNEFILNITVPVALKKQFSFSKLTVPITVSYYEDELRNHILFHREGKVKYTKAQKEAAKAEGRTLVSPTSSLSIRLMRNSKGDFDIGIGIGLQTSHDIKPKIKTVENYGLIGIDINQDHLDIAETDEKGNYLRGWSVPLDLKDKSTKQRKTVLSQATKGIVDYALSRGKSIVIEDLDFTKKKKALKDNYNKNYARMLSAFAYGKIREYFIGQCWKSGVNLLTVNPAYTSFLGNLKYRTKITTKNNEHMPAAYVIARRGQGFRERISSSILRIKLKKNVTTGGSCVEGKAGVITVERILLRKMVFDAGAASGWSKLKHLHKTVSKRGEVIDLNTGSVLSKISFLMLGSTGIPLCQELFISSRHASGNESFK